MKFLNKTLSVACLTAVMTFGGLMVTNTQSHAATAAATHTFVGYAQIHYYTDNGGSHDYTNDPTHYDAYLIH